MWNNSQNLTKEKSTLVQVMACCRQVLSYCLSQYLSSSMSPYGDIYGDIRSQILLTDLLL